MEVHNRSVIATYHRANTVKNNMHEELTASDSLAAMKKGYLNALHQNIP